MALEVAFELPPQLQEQVFREAVQSELGQGTFLLQARTLAAIASTSRRWRIWAQRLPLTVSLRRLGDELLAAGRRSDRQHPREAGIRAPGEFMMGRLGVSALGECLGSLPAWGECVLGPSLQTRLSCIP